MINCGDTFLLEDEDGCDQHLCIVVTPPVDDKVAVVSITTRRNKSETLVVLQKEDHPSLTHESVIAYRYSRVVKIEYIENAVNNKDAARREPASANLLRRAQEGLLESDFVEYGVKAFYREAMHL
ncbi:MAG: hypothetical protein WBQ09_18655 [Terriglobales bacterium]